MSGKRHRIKTITFRISQSEETAIKLFAKKSGLSIGAHVRYRALENNNLNPISDEARLLRDCVNGIDAIAAVDRKRFVDPADTERIITELRRLQLLLIRFHHAKQR